VALVPLPVGTDVIAFLGWPTDAAINAQATQHVGMVTAAVRAYTRGRGFAITGQVPEELAAVIVSATARSLSNPAQSRRIEAGSLTETPGSLASFSVLECLVLNGFRRRAG
jgi:hypothetical protein